MRLRRVVGKLESSRVGARASYTFSNLPIPKERSVVASRFRVDGKQHYSGSFPIETMNGHQGFRLAFFRSLTSSVSWRNLPAGITGKKMRFIGNQDVFILDRARARRKGWSFHFPVRGNKKCRRHLDKQSVDLRGARFHPLT